MELISEIVNLNITVPTRSSKRPRERVIPARPSRGEKWLRYATTMLEDSLMFECDGAEDRIGESPTELVVHFRNTELRLAAISELIRSHRADTHTKIEICARHYKKRALNELFPNRAWISALTNDQKDAVYSRAIQIAQRDARMQVSRPCE